MKDSIKRSFTNTMKNTVEENTASKTRKPLLTIRVGAITEWVRDILAIILMWKLIAVIY